jgi:hypothetical protein
VIRAGTASVSPRSFAAVMPSTSRKLISGRNGVHHGAAVQTGGSFGEAAEGWPVTQPPVDALQLAVANQALQRPVNGVAPPPPPKAAKSVGTHGRLTRLASMRDKKKVLRPDMVVQCLQLFSDFR